MPGIRKSSINTTLPVLIIGAGPAGLLLGHWLHHFDIPFKIFEKKAKTHQHSRAIGIHPVSLDLFEKLDLLDTFYNVGQQIPQGAGFLEDRRIGVLDFTKLPFNHARILTLPQYKTEQILRDELLDRRPDSITFNARLKSFEQTPDQVNVQIETITEAKETNITTFSGSYLIGCDGRNSTVRAESKINWTGRPYPDTYVMGDFQHDQTRLDPAAVFLHPSGVIESFALPKGQRRWVIKVNQPPDSSPSSITSIIQERLGFTLKKQNCIRSSGFGIERYQAAHLYEGRTILLGDAAHVVSPIGGQGMNLGWLGTALLARCLKRIQEGEPRSEALSHYEETQQQRARKAIRRASFNTKLGRSYHYQLPRHFLLYGMLNTPLRGITARLFTMYGLDHWPI